MTGRKLLRKEERVASILAAAARAFAVGGFAATSMDDIAAEAGVSKLILYRHFDSKHLLYTTVLDNTRARLEAALRFRSRTAQPEMVRELLAAARADPAGFALLFRHSAREPEFAEYVTRFRERSTTAAEHALAQVTPKAPGPAQAERAPAGASIADPVVRRWLARISFSVVVEGILEWLDSGDPERDEWLADRLLRASEAIAAAVLTDRGA